MEFHFTLKLKNMSRGKKFMDFLISKLLLPVYWPQKYEDIDNNSNTMWKFQWLAQVAPSLWNCIWAFTTLFIHIYCSCMKALFLLGKVSIKNWPHIFYFDSFFFFSIKKHKISHQKQFFGATVIEKQTRNLFCFTAYSRWLTTSSIIIWVTINGIIVNHFHNQA